MYRSSSVRGFTLIELLVVIAIVGILSSVILASLALARFKAADANIKSNLRNIMTMMELAYDSNGNYGTAQADGLAKRSVIGPDTTIFDTDPKIKQALQSALSQGGYTRYAVGSNSYAVAVQLRYDSSNWWCLDSTNVSKTVPDATLGASGKKLGGGGSVAHCP